MILIKIKKRNSKEKNKINKLMKIQSRVATVNPFENRYGGKGGGSGREGIGEEVQ